MTPFYLPVGAGQRFCVHFPAASASPRGTILHVHAFAEEMNKSRRAIAQAARSFAQAGWDVLLIDLAGCGDSSGELTDVTWNSWLDDLMAAARWMEHRGTRVSVIWGLRFGVLLAADLLGRIGGTPDLLLWQPVTSGRNHLTQFFRLKAASDMLGRPSSAPGSRSCALRWQPARRLKSQAMKLRQRCARILNLSTFLPRCRPVRAFYGLNREPPRSRRRSCQPRSLGSNAGKTPVR